METLAPAGVDETETARGPPCTMVAQPITAAQVPSTAPIDSSFSMTPPDRFDLSWLNWRVVTDALRRHRGLRLIESRTRAKRVLVFAIRRRDRRFNDCVGRRDLPD